MADCTDDECLCFNCALNELLSDYYPDGVTEEDAGEVLSSVAQVVGYLIGNCDVNGDEALASFLKAVDHWRRERENEAPERAEMH